jgi:hypothetical protein
LTRIVKIEGCDYRVSDEMILEWLGMYGEVFSELVEDVFEGDEDSEGDHTTGIYSVKMRLNCNIPQLLPKSGFTTVESCHKDGPEDPDLERRGILQKSPHGYSAAMGMGRIAIRGTSGV